MWCKGRHGPGGQPLETTVTPGDQSRDVPVTAEVGTAVTGGRITGVRITDDKGAEVKAEPREDTSAWVPSAPLKPKRTYATEATATGDKGKTTTRKTTFTTMQKSTKPGDHQHVVLQRQPDVRHGHAGNGRLRPSRSGKGQSRRSTPIVREDEAATARYRSWVSDGSRVYYRAPISGSSQSGV